ncbi:subunit C of the eight-subunit V1 peripheral membrane domain of vacuolar H+-ATPase [Nadsonia fulvescens var. elongata DSM 6958]|uniref:V-type proton ATPase subunit C n=1 Tax=Nadsonia fulvescens var. elongata DSM 6958 TaxID=857566 RepID=A0A1E3PI87_9ASCO|nr:subunit C of the eight-subunit V1 peripheral membrane domain of vacuolar H+-ATPase [Nadsonia fulvescens var. elongata DSM 6958]
MPSHIVLSLPPSATPDSTAPAQSLFSFLVDHLKLAAASDIQALNIPSFKIGTLDNLVQQSEELAKLDSQFSSIFSKISEILDAVNDSRSVKKVGDGTLSDYLDQFTWNRASYRVDKPIPELVELFKSEVFELDTDVREKYNAYNVAKGNLAVVERKETGNLSVRSLHSILSPSDFVLDSEYLVTTLVAVPNNSTSQFYQIYETLTPMVVPRSCKVIDSDSEYTLFSVTLFSKYLSEFVHKSREQKFTPREFNYNPESIRQQKNELGEARNVETKLHNEIIRLARTAYADVARAWVHIKAVRVFIESVLRYGLPPNFVSCIITVPAKSVPVVKSQLLEKYAYLGGRGVARDNKGRLVKDDAETTTSHAEDYEPFVYYELEF